jgi:hypothetical protein
MATNNSNNTSFATFNQFDKRFTDFEKFGNDRTACPLFGLLTAFNFMQSGDISKNQHEKNISSAVLNYMTHDIPKYMLFEELLQFTQFPDNINPSIEATTPELISQNVIGYDNIFKPPGYNQNYCAVFLKNRNYIAILVHFQSVESTDPSNHSPTFNITYCVRDCHENHQHNFTDFEQLKVFLNNTYQFEQLTIVGGLAIPEFSNIEFIVIDTPFSIVNIDADLIDDHIVDNNTYDQHVAFNVSLFDLDHELALAMMQAENESEYIEYIKN